MPLQYDTVPCSTSNYKQDDSLLVKYAVNQSTKDPLCYIPNTCLNREPYAVPVRSLGRAALVASWRMNAQTSC